MKKIFLLCVLAVIGTIGAFAQSIVAYDAHLFMGFNFDGSAGFDDRPTCLVLPADFATSEEFMDLVFKAEQHFAESPALYDATIKKMESELQKIKERGTDENGERVTPEYLNLLEEQIDWLRKEADEQRSEGQSLSSDELESMLQEVFSHAVVKEYFWSGSTMYGNIVALSDRKSDKSDMSTLNQDWGIMNDRGEWVIPCGKYKQGAEFNWANARADVILLRDSEGICLFRSDGSLITPKKYIEAYFLEAPTYTAIAVMLDKIDPLTGHHFYGLVDPKTGKEIQQYDYEDIRLSNGENPVVYGWRNHDNKKYVISENGEEVSL